MSRFGIIIRVPSASVNSLYSPRLGLIPVASERMILSPAVFIKPRITKKMHPFQGDLLAR